jgi:hypothetical protein
MDRPKYETTGEAAKRLGTSAQELRAQATARRWPPGVWYRTSGGHLRVNVEAFEAAQAAALAEEAAARAAAPVDGPVYDARGRRLSREEVALRRFRETVKVV